MTFKITVTIILVLCFGCENSNVGGDNKIENQAIKSDEIKELKNLNWIKVVGEAKTKNLGYNKRFLEIFVEKRRGEYRNVLLGFNQPFPQLDISVREILELNSVNMLGFKTIRFPGGTHGNFYHWGEDIFDSNDLKYFWDKKDKHKVQLYKNYGKGGRNLGLNDFLDWVLKTGTEPVFVLNVITQKDSDKMIRVLEEAAKSGIKLKFCELGNELYFYTKEKDNQYKDSTAEILRRIRDLTKEIRLRLPEVKLGVPVWDNEDWNKGLVWNDNLRNALLDFDACVLHTYVDDQGLKNTYLGTEPELFVSERLNKILARISSFFPDKEIWITEWNVIDKPNFRIGKTLFGVIYTADFLVQTLRNSHVNMVLQHCLLSRSFGVLDVKKNDKNFTVNRHYPYFFWSEMSKIIKGNYKTGEAQTKFNSNVPNDLHKEISAQFFLQGKKLSLLLINKSDSPWVVGNVFFDGKPEKSGTIVIITGPYLKKIVSDDSNSEPIIRKAYRPNFEIPPFSVSILRLDTI